MAPWKEKRKPTVLMYICYVHILIDLHSNKSFILLYSAPDMKRQQIMGGCGLPWEAREQIKRKATQGNKAMFWCCVIKYRHGAGGRVMLQYTVCLYVTVFILFGFCPFRLTYLIQRNQLLPALLLFFDTSTLSIPVDCPKLPVSLKPWPEVLGRRKKGWLNL